MADTEDQKDDGKPRNEFSGFIITNLDSTKPGKLKPVSVVDIGSNSVRMVVYDGPNRSPAPIFNEKILAGLGRGVATTGELSQEGVARALAALRRFSRLNEQIGAKRVYPLATAAARDAANGPAFIKAAGEAIGQDIHVLTGEEEAHFAACGLLAGIPEADGVAGDLGGGSLELVSIKRGKIKTGVTLPLGPLRLTDLSGGQMTTAAEIIEETLRTAPVMKKLDGRAFYAVGGAWRNLARIHMERTGYPLRVIQQYAIPRHEALRLTEDVSRMTPEDVRKAADVSERRAETLPLASLVLNRLLSMSGARNLVFSALGVREGVLYASLPRKKRKADPLLSATWDFARRYSRSPAHELELCRWTDLLCVPDGVECTRRWTRLRYAAAMLADIGWRAHPDYRGSRAFTLVSQANFTSIDHYSRAFLALCVYFRYQGVFAAPPAEIAALVDDKAIRRARVLAGAFRLAYMLSAAMPGALPNIPLELDARTVTLKLPGEYAALKGETITKRLSQLAKALGRTGVVE